MEENTDRKRDEIGAAPEEDRSETNQPKTEANNYR